jgi:hypothetical protein
MSTPPIFRQGQILTAEALNTVARAAFGGVRMSGTSQGMSTASGQLAIPPAEMTFAVARLMQPWQLGGQTPAGIKGEYPWTIAELLLVGNGPDGRQWGGQQTQVPVIAPFSTRRHAAQDTLLAGRVGEHVLLFYERHAGVWLYLGPERPQAVAVRITSSEPDADGLYDAVELYYDSNTQTLQDGAPLKVKLLENT